MNLAFGVLLSVQDFVLGKKKVKNGACRRHLINLPKQIVINNMTFIPYLASLLQDVIGQDKRTNSLLLRKKPICDKQVGFFHLVS
jgi:hypothetical protein